MDRAGANAQAAELAEPLGCPLIPTRAGTGQRQIRPPERVFGFGEGGIKARLEADVILVAGSRIGNLDLPYDRVLGRPREPKPDPRSIPTPAISV